MLSSTIEIMNLLIASGLNARFVGGCVRDQILGIEPHDYDLVSNGSPEIITAILRDRSIKTTPVGANYGITVVIHNGFQIEIAPLRIDGYSTDGRHPDQVTFTDSFEEDALRRDFTINALSQSVTGKIFDYVGGLADIESRTLRFIGNPPDRIHEDKLRMLRAIRFACKSDFTMHPDTLKAIQDHAELITQVSYERTRDELLKILSVDPRKGLELLDLCGLLRYVLPEVWEIKGCKQDCIWHPEGDVFIHTLIVADMLKGKAPLLILAGVLHDIGKPATSVDHGSGRISAVGHAEVGAELAKELCKRLHFSNSDTNYIVTLVSNHMRAHTFSEMRKGKLIAFKRDLGEMFEDLVELQHADSMGDLDKSQRAWILANLAEITEKSEVDPLVTGRDLISLGFKPGPKFKQVLASIRTLQDADEVTDKEQALRIAKALME